VGAFFWLPAGFPVSRQMLKLIEKAQVALPAGFDIIKI